MFNATVNKELYIHVEMCCQLCGIHAGKYMYFVRRCGKNENLSCGSGDTPEDAFRKAYRFVQCYNN